jgi:hypothetical protein
VPSPDRRKFVNPLTQPTIPPADASTETSMLPSTDAQTLPNTYTSTLPPVQHRKRGAQAFEKTHERVTYWMDKRLKQAFENLADEQGAAKTTLLNEAIADLLKKYEA